MQNSTICCVNNSNIHIEACSFLRLHKYYMEYCRHIWWTATIARCKAAFIKFSQIQLKSANTNLKNKYWFQNEKLKKCRVIRYTFITDVYSTVKHTKMITVIESVKDSAIRNILYNTKEALFCFPIIKCYLKWGPIYLLFYFATCQKRIKICTVLFSYSWLFLKALLSTIPIRISPGFKHSFIQSRFIPALAPLQNMSTASGYCPTLWWHIPMIL